MDAFGDSSKEEDHKGGQIFHSPQQLQQPHKKSCTVEDYHRLDPLLKAKATQLNKIKRMA